MQTRYKLIISSATIYKEIQLPLENTTFCLGTTRRADARFHFRDFHEEFEVVLERTDDIWQMNCSDNVYFSVGDVRKLIFMELRHGSRCNLRTQNTGRNLLQLAFSIDFDYEDKIYDAEIALKGTGYFTIGSNPNANILLLDNYAAKVVEVVNQGTRLQMQIKDAAYGVCHNGISVEKSCTVNNTDFFSIGQFSFYYKDSKLYISNSSNLNVRGLEIKRVAESANSFIYPRFNRSTMQDTILSDEEIEILEPAENPQKPENNLISSLMPSILMLILVVVIRGFMSDGSNVSYILFSVCSMALGIVTSIVSFFKGKQKYKDEVSKRENTYSEYMRKKCDEIKEAREKEAGLLNVMYPDELDTLKLIDDFSGQLFDRSPERKNYLTVRIGNGDEESRRKIVYKKKERLSPGDELEELPQQIEQNYRMLNDVPVICDLKEIHNIGILGSEMPRYQFLKILLLDLCAHHYFKDVKVYLVFDEKRKKQLSWLRFLPHVQNDCESMRNIVCGESSRIVQYEALFKELCRREAAPKTARFQDIVVFLIDEMGIKNHPLSKYLKEAYKYQVYFIFFEVYKEQLPMYCGGIIELNNANGGVMIHSDNSEIKQYFEYKLIEDTILEQAVWKLAPVYCEEISLESTLTKNITLFELLSIFSADDLNLTQRWQAEDICKTMAAPIGVKNKNEIIYLDLHEKAHGPHGLVAGTTGSGKSEILQTYILSMATLFSPHEVGFVLIDFKGGGMANQFKNLPHLLGAITDIDGKEIHRSLLSIRAELDRRKELFALAGVNNINHYIQKYRTGEIQTALPHLIIIVDEFAELKAEQPEFMKELISASRIGRSLGVHLILATQKPAGQVNDQIWSNSRFKLCLKVQTREDSNEVIKSPLAAEIVEPGRAYLQVGNNEIFELFQSAYSGASEKVDYDHVNSKEYKIAKVDLAGKRTVIYEQKKEKSIEESRTQLEVLVRYIDEYCLEHKVEKLANICLPPLPEILDYPENMQAEKNGGEITASIGIYDAPSNQYQGKIEINLSNENTLIIGAAQYGKTNLLQVIIRGLAEKYTPDEVNIYILDFASMFLKNYEQLPHVGGVVCASDEEKLKNLFKLLNQEIVLRKDRLIAAGVSSFSSYLEAGYRDLPQIVLMVDNFTALKETYFADDDFLLPLCREGLAVGISIIIANIQTNGFGYRYFSTISNQIGFYCNDGDEMNTLFGYCRMRPDAIPGRCLIKVDKTVYEAQTYRAFDGKREIDRSNNVSAFVREMQVRYPEQRARKIPSVPERLTMPLLYEFAGDLKKRDGFAVALDYESIECKVLDFRKQFILTLLGANEKGKKQFLDNLFEDIRVNMFERNINLYFIDAFSKPYIKYAEMPYMKTYSSQPDVLLSVITELEEILQDRNMLLEENGDEILDSCPLELIIVNNRKGLDVLSSSKTEMKAFENIAKNYRNCKVMFLFADVNNISAGYSAPELYKKLRDEKKAIIFDSLKEVKLFEISGTIIRKNNGVLRNTDAFYLDGEELNKVKLAGKESYG